MKVDYLPKGIAFTRLAIALALAKDNGGDTARRIAANRWGEDSPTFKMLSKAGAGGINALLTKAAVPAGSTTSANWASELHSAISARTEFFALVRERSLIGRIEGLRRIPLRTRIVTEASGFGAAWVGEGAAVPVSDALYEEGDPLPALKVSSLAIFTNELLTSLDPAAELLIRDGMVKAAVEAIDLSFLDPTNSGVANVKPASITNGVTAENSTDDGLQDVRNLVDHFTGDLEQAIIIGTPQTFAKLHDPIMVPGIGVRGGEVLGIPALPSKQAGDDLILVDPTGIAIGEGEMELRVATQASIQMADNPTMNAVEPTGAATVSLWQCNSTAIMAEKYLNWEVARPGSVAVVTGIDLS